MFRCKDETRAAQGPISGLDRLRAGRPGVTPAGSVSGFLDYRLGVVGERSPGDEGESRGLLERGEVRIPE